VLKSLGYCSTFLDVESEKGRALTVRSVHVDRSIVLRNMVVLFVRSFVGGQLVVSGCLLRLRWKLMFVNGKDRGRSREMAHDAFVHFGDK
jgi:hypothetical protein